MLDLGNVYLYKILCTQLFLYNHLYFKTVLEICNSHIFEVYETTKIVQYLPCLCVCFTSKENVLILTADI